MGVGNKAGSAAPAGAAPARVASPATGWPAGRAAGRAAGWATDASRRLGAAVETVAALLTAVEVVVLFSGIVARYAFHRPLVWADELASTLFLWLAMLGAVAALGRGEHMRMTALANRATPRRRAFLEALALAASILFLALIMVPGLEYARDEVVVLTPTLEISGGWRAAALPAGTGLMILLGLLRLVRMERPRDVLAAVAAGAAAAGAVWLLHPALSGLGSVNLVLFFILGVGGMVFAGIPIAFAFGLATIGYLAATTAAPLSIIVGRLDEGMSHLINLAIPLFVLLGLLIGATGMARAMVDLLASLLGHVRGGLSYVLLGGMYLVSGISGSKVADMAAVAPVLFPEMKRRGMRDGELVAQLATAGAMAETIPPSIVLIMIGSVTGVSISALFTGGLLPALVAALALAAVVWLRARREDRPGSGQDGGRQDGGRRVARSFAIALPALILPFVIRAAVVEGIATATEVSTIGIAYALLVGALFYRQLDWRRLMPMLAETASLSGAVLLIIGTATGMAWALTQSGFSHQLAALMTALPGGAVSFLALSVVAFVILGSLLEGLPAVVLFGPLLFPIARQVGVHEVHYAMVVILAMGIGLFAPPFGVGYYAACAIGRVDPREGVRPI